MKVLLVLLHAVLSVVLIGAVLAQHRRSSGFSGIFGGGTLADLSGGQWRKLPFMTKATVVLLVLFMVSSLALAFVFKV